MRSPAGVVAARGEIRRAASLGLSAEDGVAEDPGARRRGGRHGLLAFASLVALLGLSTAGCKDEPRTIPANKYPEELASSYCKAVYGCACESYPYANLNECFAELVTAYAVLNNDAYSAGLTYDGSCPAQEVDAVDAMGCKSSGLESPTSVCLPPCHGWHGSTGIGGLCEVIASSVELGIAFTNCAQGLSCMGVCVDPCQIGGTLPGLGQPCPGSVCTAGAMCDPETMICVVEQPYRGPVSSV
jgi:hypothetical protein